MKIITIEWFK